MHRSNDNDEEERITQSADDSNHGLATNHIPHAAAAGARHLTQLPGAEGKEDARLPDPPITRYQQTTLPRLLRISGGSHNQCNLRKLVPTDTARKRKGEDSCNVPSSCATEQSPHATAEIKRKKSSKQDRTEALDTNGKRPPNRFEDNNIHDPRAYPSAGRLVGKHRATTAPAREAGHNRRVKPPTTGACNTEQDAKKRRRATPSPSTGTRANEGETKKTHVTPLQLRGSYGLATTHAQGSDASTSGNTQHCNGTRQQAVSTECKALQVRIRVNVQSGDANASMQDKPLNCTMRTGIQAAASRSNDVAEIYSAYGSNVASLPKRDGGATQFQEAAKKRALPTAHGRNRRTDSAHTDRPRYDAGSVELRPSKRRGGPSPVRDDKVHPGSPARLLGRATVGPCPRHHWRGASMEAAASAQAVKVRRVVAPPKQVPDARLAGRGWHERWPPPAQGSGGPNGRAAR